MRAAKAASSSRPSATRKVKPSTRASGTPTTKVPSSRSGRSGGTAAAGAGRAAGAGAAGAEAVKSPVAGMRTTKDLRDNRLKFTLDDLELKATLGTGTFGRVRLALHKPSGKHYALKILQKSEVGYVVFVGFAVFRSVVTSLARLPLPFLPFPCSRSSD